MNASDELDSGKEPLLNNGMGTQQNGKATKNGQNGVKKSNNNKTSLVDAKTTSVQQKSEKVTLMGGDEPKKKQGCCSLMWNWKKQGLTENAKIMINPCLHLSNFDKQKEAAF